MEMYAWGSLYLYRKRFDPIGTKREQGVVIMMDHPQILNPIHNWIRHGLLGHNGYAAYESY